MAHPIRIGTAGWAVPRTSAEAFPAQGTGLQRYAARLDVAEINSSFYRPHRVNTWQRWRDSTPAGFQFAVKIPKAISHEARLVDCETALDAFLAQARLLDAKLGPLLLQLPPSLAFDAAVAERFLAALRQRHEGPIACEPRHTSWFEAEGEALLTAFQVARVAADPARHVTAASPGGWRGLAYWRLHGSPRMYYSSYEAPFLQTLALALKAGPAASSWCIFDNTTLGFAAANALNLRALLTSPP